MDLFILLAFYILIGSPILGLAMLITWVWNRVSPLPEERPSARQYGR